MSDIFNLGLVGCGRISQAYMEAVKLSDDIKINAVMDVRAETAKAVAEAENCTAYEDIDSLIANAKVDGVIVCVPPAFHKEIACKLLTADIPVLCEKPLAISLDDAMTMVETAAKRDVPLMMASKFRYVEDVIRTKSIIETGMIGEIQFYENFFTAEVNMANRWNADPKVSGGGVLIDNGPHAVDMVRYLISPITKVFAHENVRSAKLPVEDTVTLSFITKSNVMGTIYLSWTSHVDRAYIDVCGTEGSAQINWEKSMYQRNGFAKWVPYGVGYNKVSAFQNQVINFVETIRKKSEPLLTVEDGLASVAVLEAAYRSLEKGNWENVE